MFWIGQLGEAFLGRWSKSTSRALFWGKAFQVEGTENAKALRPVFAWQCLQSSVECSVLAAGYVRARVLGSEVRGGGVTVGYIGLWRALEGLCFSLGWVPSGVRSRAVTWSDLQLISMTLLLCWEKTGVGKGRAGTAVLELRLSFRWEMLGVLDQEEAHFGGSIMLMGWTWWEGGKAKKWVKGDPLPLVPARG